MDAFRDLIGKLPGRLDGMANSYASAADAYLRYLPSLEEAQTMSLRALDQARQAAGDQSAAQAAAVSAAAALLVMNADTTTSPDAKEQATDDATAAKNRAADAQQALDGAKSLLGQATALRDQAARTAADTLHQLAKDAPQRSLWDKIVEAFNAFIDFLQSTVIEWITTILDVLSVVASFIFPPLGSAIGFLSGAIDLAAAALGGDPAEIALAAGGLALGLVPGGRIVSRVLKFANKFAGKIRPGSVADGIKNSTREVTGGSATTVGRGIDENVTRIGIGKTIKGVFGGIRQKISDIRFDRDLKAAKKKQDKDPTLIIGQTDNGRLTTFHASDVRSVPLRDNNGKQIGVLFPSEPDDVGTFTDWAKVEANVPLGRTQGGSLNVDGAKLIRRIPGTQAPMSTDQFELAPWGRLKSPPVFVIAHGDPHSAAVTLNNGKVLSVPGTQFARVVHFDNVFRAAAEGNPKGSIALLSCNFANPTGSAGQDFANVMRDLGNNRKIFASTEVVQASRGVDVDGLFTSPGNSIANVTVENMGVFKEMKPDVTRDVTK
ncbi:hypothetical protein [Micromonospora sp. CA-246542]|uniref:hypothetical protein n=1 Tax=Micromonospora sp. CA-246542 TaxID=3239959 RepID=UPI003D8DAAA4